MMRRPSYLPFVLLALLAGLAGAYIFHALAPRPAAVAATATEESVYDRVIRTGTLRCGYIVYPPATIKDLNTGKLSGIFVDAVDQAAQSLNLKVEWTEEVAWGTMIQGLIDNRYDAVCSGIWENVERARVADFSKPLFYSAIGAYVNANDTRFDSNLALLNDPSVRVAVINGETNELIAKTRFPKATRVELPQGSDFSQLLLNVTSGKADVVFVEPAVGADFLKNNPGKIRNIAAAKPLLVLPNTIMMKRGQVEFKAMLDSALDQMLNSGGIDDLLTRYEPFTGAYYRMAYPYRPEQYAKKHTVILSAAKTPRIGISIIPFVQADRQRSACGLDHR